MNATTEDRIGHIVDTIADIETLLDGRTIDFIKNDRFARAAYERLLEIVSEASRHVPLELRQRLPSIPWRDIADLGNRLRHGYDRLHIETLWRIYESGELRGLKAAVSQFLKQDPPQ
jgi:uncharacterized protein with HEPN domain